MTAVPVAALMQRMMIALQARRRSEINSIAAELIRRRADLGARWQMIADVLLFNGEVDLARSAAALLRKAAGDSPTARFVEANVLARVGAVDEARALIATVPAGVPDPASHAYALGTMHLALGDREQAVVALDRATAANPASGQAWLARAMTATRTDAADLAERLWQAEGAIARAAPIEQAQYRFALGKVLDDLDEVDAAFDAFCAANALMAPIVRHDPRANEQRARDAASFDAEAIARVQSAVRVRSARPIVVTGSPRSGTTLVESILVSHSQVSNGEELGRFDLIAGEIGGLSRPAFDAWMAQGGAPDTLASLYLHLFSQRFGTQGRAVDKTTDASGYLGLLAALLPDAPLIWLRRDPVDRALSCFRHYFVRGAAWSYDLAHIAHHFALEDRLLAHWQRVLGTRLLVIDYETLVSDPAHEIARLLAHCGLPEEPAVFAPQATRRVVTTTSVMQVRDPINTGAVGKSERYRRHLAPFIDSYATASR
jgi:tetratricopeptide (TPR) repeat protein